MSAHIGITVLKLDQKGLNFGDSKTVKIFEGNILENGDVNKDNINKSFDMEKNVVSNNKLQGEDDLIV